MSTACGPEDCGSVPTAASNRLAREVGGGVESSAHQIGRGCALDLSTAYEAPRANDPACCRRDNFRAYTDDTTIDRVSHSWWEASSGRELHREGIPGARNGMKSSTKLATLPSRPETSETNNGAGGYRGHLERLSRRRSSSGHVGTSLRHSEHLNRVCERMATESDGYCRECHEHVARGNANGQEGHTTNQVAPPKPAMK